MVIWERVPNMFRTFCSEQCSVPTKDFYFLFAADPPQNSDTAIYMELGCRAGVNNAARILTSARSQRDLLFDENALPFFILELFLAAF